MSATIRKVAAINDISGLGRCSLTAAIPILSAMSVQACPIPTAVLTNQTGFESFFMDDCTDNIEKYLSEWKKLGLSFNAIYSGFLSSPGQIDAIMRFVAEFKTSGTLLLVDPVMADNGMIYDTYSKKMCERLTEFAFTADVVTPNLTEACIMADDDYNEYLKSVRSGEFQDVIFNLAQKISDRGPDSVVITGVHANERGEDKLYSFAYSKTSGQKTVVCNKMFGGGYSGAGDITASIICASLVNGDSLENALTTACKFIETAVKFTFSNAGYTNRSKNEGIQFEPFLNLLCNPPKNI